MEELDEQQLKDLEKLDNRLQNDINKIADPTNQYVAIYKKRLEDTTKKLAEAYKRIASMEIARDEMLGLIDNDAELPKWVVESQNESKKSSNQIPIILSSDWHYGESVNPKEVPNGNSYSPKVADQRIQRLTQSVINKISSKGKTYNGVIVCFLGDDISGDIHDELKESNELTSMESVIQVAGQKVKMIQELKNKMKNVWVISVPGNHGRNTIKMPSKNLVEHNYDSLVTMLVEAHFKNDKNVSFYTPKSGEAYFSVNGVNFLATHGDRIGSRGGQGFIGPSATIARGQHKTRQAYAQIGKPIDWLLVGHFHTPMQLEHTIANGTLVGYNQYARDLRIEPDYPSQTMFMVDSEYGVTDVSKIYVSNKEEMTKDRQIFRSNNKKSDFDNKPNIPLWIKHKEYDK